MQAQAAQHTLEMEAVRDECKQLLQRQEDVFDRVRFADVDRWVSAKSPLVPGLMTDAHLPTIIYYLRLIERREFLSSVPR